MLNTLYSSAQFTKDTGTTLLKTFVGILQDLVMKLQGFQESAQPEPTAVDSQEGSDLFLESNQSAIVESNREKVIGKIFCD